MNLQLLIEKLVEEVLSEVNSISVGGAALLSPDSVQGFQGGGLGISGEGIGEEGEGFDADISDENFDQLGQRDKHHKELINFLWNGDDPKNKPPKVKFVAV